MYRDYFIIRFKAQLVLILLIFFAACKKEPNQKDSQNQKLTTLQGAVFGTSYNIKYDSSVNYQNSIDSIYYLLNKSLSTYQVNSDISRINRNEEVKVDDFFEEVFATSKKIYQETDGEFDPTIGAVVNAWDFGPQGSVIELDSLKIDSLMVDVGFDKVSLKSKSISKHQNTYLDFNAIAKGYAVDVIAEFFNERNVENFLVEIGGEIRVKGVNSEKHTNWTVGIEEPNFDGKQSVFKAIELNDESMATSGVYRKFKVDEKGNRFSHIIDTKTGYPSKTNILGVSVIAETCIEADAYATAFKSMGISRIERFLESHTDLKAFIIFENDQGKIDTMSLNGFP